MASSKLSSTALFLTLNLLFFTMVSSQTLLTCSLNTANLSVCANLLGLVIIETPPYQCCTLIQGLVDLEAYVCLCTALKANVLGIITVDLDVALTTILTRCGKSKPSGYVCTR